VLGVRLDRIEADAQSLPFPDPIFDVVTSCFGAIVAPDEAAVANENEMLRVCRPGGVIGMISFRPEGLAAEPERLAALDREFREFAMRANRGAPAAPPSIRIRVSRVVAGHGRRHTRSTLLGAGCSGCR
jgi:ubiquinone/menaquinone biosynthesis C-methylase UbiE